MRAESTGTVYQAYSAPEVGVPTARAGRFRGEPLMFHLAGISSYLLVAELAVNQVLDGELPRPACPQALRKAAPEAWLGRARATIQYARSNNVPRGQPPRSRVP